MNNTDNLLSSFTIVSFNCKGINQKTKRDKIFNTFKAYHADIICLQETNLNPTLANQLKQFWHLDLTWNYFMAILINNSKFHLIKFSSSSNG